jgi:hypothetical protein
VTRVPCGVVFTDRPPEMPAMEPFGIPTILLQLGLARCPFQRGEFNTAKSQLDLGEPYPEFVPVEPLHECSNHLAVRVSVAHERVENVTFCHYPRHGRSDVAWSLPISERVVAETDRSRLRQLLRRDETIAHNLTRTRSTLGWLVSNARRARHQPDPVSMSKPRTLSTYYVRNSRSHAQRSTSCIRCRTLSLPPR